MVQGEDHDSVMAGAPNRLGDTVGLDTAVSSRPLSGPWILASPRVAAPARPRAHGFSSILSDERRLKSADGGAGLLVHPGDIDHRGQRPTDVILPPEIRLVRLAAELP